MNRYLWIGIIEMIAVLIIAIILGLFFRDIESYLLGLCIGIIEMIAVLIIAIILGLFFRDIESYLLGLCIGIIGFSAIAFLIYGWIKEAQKIIYGDKGK
ncbi:unnamed protein product [marine sediment metagenome]|uniref:Uncharacterized protein n=1 Tax=marine sediment metagenome TaxID=412755 RepID=X1B036_9ZZZZ